MPKAAPGRRNRSRLGVAPRAEDTAADPTPQASLRAENESLKAEVSRLTCRVAELEGALSRIRAEASSIAGECERALGTGA